MSLRCARSPVAPMMTMVHGSGIRLRAEPARRGLSSRTVATLLFAAPAGRRNRLTKGSLRGLDRMPSELVSQSCQHLIGKRVGLPRRETAEERLGDDWCGHVFVDSRLHRPSALAGILHETSQRVE